MIVKNQKDIKQEEVTMASSKGTYIQWLIKDEAPNFAMRRFEIKPNGSIGLHNHPEEHEIYILEGEGEVYNDRGENALVSKGNVLYVPPNEKHGYKNHNNNETFIFLCIIPLLKK